MRNYQTDGGSIVNFLTEIDNIDLNDDENICLISNQPLDETHVALKCGHKFNYHSIYNDLVRVKNNYRMLPYKISLDQIQCPFCRQVQRGLLPYSSKFKLPKKDGVNWIDIKKHFQHPVSSQMGDCNVASCEKNTQVMWDDEKVTTPFCFFHYNRKCPKTPRKKPVSIISNTLLSQEVNITNEVVSLQPPSTPKPVPPTPSCQVLLKSGPRKGTPCGARIKVNGACLRHQEKSV
jgi:hypothetical protein